MKKILVVDDDPVALASLNHLLCERYELAFCISGREALEAIKKVNPDLVLTDVSMPEMSGLQLCEKIKNDPDTTHIPVVTISAHCSDTKRIDEAKAAGVAACLDKPATQDDLVSTIEGLLSPG